MTKNNNNNNNNNNDVLGFASKDSRSTQMEYKAWTLPMVMQRVRDYQIGDKVYINGTAIEEGTYKTIKTKILATITERYEKFLVVKTEQGIEEGFLYQDIVFLKVIEKYIDKKKARKG